jgi:hypothetical protein
VKAHGSKHVQRLAIADGDMQSWKLGTSDINFDGFADLYVITSAGTANAYARYWRFVADRSSYEDLGNVPVFKRDADSQRLTTHERNGAAGLAYEDCEYRIEAGKPVLWRQERQEESERAGTFERTVAPREGSELKVVEHTQVTAP